MNPAMQSVELWLEGAGRAAFEQALGTAGTWAYDRK